MKSAAAAAGSEQVFDIPADTAEVSLQQFASQSGLEVLYATERVAGIKTNPVKGRLSPSEAIRQLLEGTSLIVVNEGRGVVWRIARVDDPKALQAPLTESTRQRQLEFASKADAAGSEAKHIQIFPDTQPNPAQSTYTKMISPKKNSSFWSKLFGRPPAPAEEESGAAAAPNSVDRDSTSVHPSRPKRRSLVTVLIGWAALGLGPETIAVSSGEQTGTVAGRVYNPATGEYVRNAEIRIQGSSIIVFSGNDGSYRLANLPSGEVTLTAIYAGYRTSIANISVVGGQVVAHDFELREASVQDGQDVIELSRFTVSSELEGNAKALMEQRAAMNIKSVVASDAFGDLSEGNVGELLQYLYASAWVPSRQECGSGVC